MKNCKYCLHFALVFHLFTNRMHHVKNRFNPYTFISGKNIKFYIKINRVINIQLQLPVSFTVSSKICLSHDYQFSTYRNSTAETGRLLEKSYKLTVGKVVARDEFNSVDSFTSFIFACISSLSLKNCLCSRNNCN